MDNYIYRLMITVATEIKKKIDDGNPWSVEDFKELVMEADKVFSNRQSIRRCVYTILDMLPGMDKDLKAQAWEEISSAFLAPKSYSVRKVRLQDLAYEDIEAHIGRVIAAKAKV